MLDKLEPKEWLELNAKLQQKKRNLRKELSKRGILKREGNNKFDNYKYFSEAQYKELFTELFSEFGLELSFDEISYETFSVEGKQPNGRMPKIRFYLYDCDTGFYETTSITGEGIDKGDKAGYKAYTGALKYFLADKFMVATGDDPETESPDGKATVKYKTESKFKVNETDVSRLIMLAKEAGVEIPTICEWAGVEHVEDMTKNMWASACRKLQKTIDGGKNV